MGSRLHYGVGSLFFAVRDLLSPPIRRLKAVAITPGDVVLDYGCGIGGHSVAAAHLVGESGHVYAADVLPFAVRTVERRALRKKLRNLSTILTDHDLPLETDSVNVVLLYDLLHDLDRADLVLEELHRVLRPDGILSVSDHHMADEDIIEALTVRSLFVLRERHPSTLSFAKP